MKTRKPYRFIFYGLKMPFIVSGAIILLFALTQSFHNRPKTPLKLAFPGSWKVLHPGLQHTLWGGLLLSNQFDPLVTIDERGVVVPKAAESWVISEDFKTFQFKIDTSLRFPDGTTLAAKDFKNSWEESLGKTPHSSNSSVADVLYQIEGYEDFKNKGSISGIIAKDDKTLELHFKRPFRMALTHLKGTRFAAFKNVGGKLMGTGVYQIDPMQGYSPEEQLLLIPNPYHPKTVSGGGVSTVQVKQVTYLNLAQSFLNKELDAVGYAVGIYLPPELLAQKHIRTLKAGDAGHAMVTVNATPGRIFSNPNLRRAIQYLILEKCKSGLDRFKESGFFEPDPQVFLPVQAGRISNEEARAIVLSGEKFAKELLEKSKSNPITLFYSESTAWLPGALKEAGLTLSEKSRLSKDDNEYFSLIYKTFDFDLITGSFSVVDGDPDGIYHALGKSGAILSPVSYRPEVGHLLEEGRVLIEPGKLDQHYQKVTKAVLETVPVVHLGYTKAVAIYRDDRVRVEAKFLSRNQGHLEIFEAK